MDSTSVARRRLHRPPRQVPSEPRHVSLPMKWREGLVWIQERVEVFQKVVGRRTEGSALLLRALLGKIRLEPMAREGCVPTTGPCLTCRSSLCSTWDPRRRTRNLVLLLCDGGGGGSRTRVRKRQARGHSMLSLFLVLARPPREEAKRRQGNPEFVSPLRPGIRSGYTRISRRQPERGGCAHRTNVAT